MVLACAALVLSLSAAAPDAGARQRAARDDNAARARRGLLPRKVPPPPRERRIVLLQSAPTSRGEPGADPVPAGARVPPGPARRPAGTVAATLTGVRVDVTLVLRLDAK